MCLRATVKYWCGKKYYGEYRIRCAKNDTPILADTLEACEDFTFDDDTVYLHWQVRCAYRECRLHVQPAEMPLTEKGNKRLVVSKNKISIADW